MMPFENDHKSTKFETLKPFFLSFSHWHVKGFSPKRIALKVDVTGLENILFAGASVYHSARKFTGFGSKGVNGPWEDKTRQKQTKLKITTIAVLKPTSSSSLSC